MSYRPRSLRRFLTSLLASLVVASGLVVAVVAAPSGADVSDGWAVIDVGYNHTCGVTTVGEAYCWGQSTEGALGNGESGGPGRERLPNLVPAPAGVTWASIDAGQYHTCGLSTDGDLFCWGNDNLDVGTLGNGPVVDGQFRYPDPTPVVTPAGVTWASVSAGRHTCALTTTGDAYCWGLGGEGQIGDGATENRDVPTLVAAPAGVVWDQIHVGSPDSNNFGSQHTCAVSTTGAGYCWGSDAHGQLGDGPVLATVSVPTPVSTPAGRTWASIRPGLNHTCGVTDDGAGWCWGRPDAGRLGGGPVAESEVPEPAAVAAPITWDEIVAGSFYSCGVTTAGDLHCWGSEGSSGYMGNGGPVYDLPKFEPTPVSTPAEVDGWRLVSTGDQHTCAVDIDDVGWCWGRDVDGKLGNGGTDTQSDVPTQVLGEEPAGGPQTIEQFFMGGTRTLDDSPFQVRGITASGLEITFTSETPTVCTTGDETQQDGFTRVPVTLHTLGACTITATQPGDATWDAAPPVTRTTEVIGLPATIELSDLAQTYDGTPREVGVTTTPAGLATIVTYDGSTFLPTDAGSYAVEAIVAEEGYDPVRANETLVIAQATQTIAFDPLGDIEFGDPAVPLSAIASSGLPVAFAAAGPCSIVGATVEATGAGTCTVTATQPGDDNHLAAAPVQRSFDIAGATSTLTVTDWSSTYDGAPHPVSVATDPAGLATTVTYDGSPTAPTDAGSYAVVVTVIETGYDPKQVTGTLTIAKASQTITFAPVDDLIFGWEDTFVNAQTTSGLPVSLSVSGPCILDGNRLDSTGAGTCTVTATQDGDANHLAADPVSRGLTVAKASTSATLVGPGEAIEVGTPATFVLTVDGPGMPTGTASFVADTGATAEVPVVDGRAEWTTTDLPLGISWVRADYSGSADLDPSGTAEQRHEVVTAPLSLAGLPDTVQAGDEIQVDATGFEPGEDVEFVFESDPVVVGAGVADAIGATTLTFSVPDVEAGSHSLTATGLRSGLQATAATTVVEESAPGTSSPTTETTIGTTPAVTTPVTSGNAGSTGDAFAGRVVTSPRSSTGSLARTGAPSTIALSLLGALLLGWGVVIVSSTSHRPRHLRRD